MRFKQALILRALIPALLVWAISFAAQAQLAPASDADKAPTILACFNAGQTAIRDLRACAQAWLTPKALLLCALQNTDAGKAGPIACPFLPDTPGGRAILDVLLVQQHLTRASNLSLDTRNFPGLPSADAIDACNKTAATQADFLACLRTSMRHDQSEVLLQCIEASESETGRALCLAKSATADPDLPASVKCSPCKAPRPINLYPASAPPIESPQRRRRSHALAAPEPPHRRSPIVFYRVPPQPKKLSRACLTQSQDDDRSVAGCLGNFSPAMGRAEQASACLSDPGNSAAKCAQELLGDTTHVAETVAACAATRRNALVGCFLIRGPSWR